MCLPSTLSLIKTLDVSGTVYRLYWTSVRLDDRLLSVFNGLTDRRLSALLTLVCAQTDNRGANRFANRWQQVWIGCVRRAQFACLHGWAVRRDDFELPSAGLGVKLQHVHAHRFQGITHLIEDCTRHSICDAGRNDHRS